MSWPWKKKEVSASGIDESPIDAAINQGYPLFRLCEDGKIEEISRVDWDSYFMMIAEQVASRGTCNRKQVGCILVKDKRILATGYNGSISGTEHCDDVGHLMEDGHCVRTVHAEINALAQCSKYGIACDESIAYINTCPCWSCFKALVNAGVKEIFYRDPYKPELKELVFKYAEELGIPLKQI